MKVKTLLRILKVKTRIASLYRNSSLLVRLYYNLPCAILSPAASHYSTLPPLHPSSRSGRLYHQGCITTPRAPPCTLPSSFFLPPSSFLNHHSTGTALPISINHHSTGTALPISMRVIRTLPKIRSGSSSGVSPLEEGGRRKEEGGRKTGE